MTRYNYTGNDDKGRPVYVAEELPDVPLSQITVWTCVECGHSQLVTSIPTRCHDCGEWGLTITDHPADKNFSVSEPGR
jgi:rubrerythrin